MFKYNADSGIQAKKQVFTYQKGINFPCSHQLVICQNILTFYIESIMCNFTGGVNTKSVKRAFHC